VCRQDKGRETGFPETDRKRTRFGILFQDLIPDQRFLTMSRHNFRCLSSAKTLPLPKIAFW
jgi:hypothetical protein